MCRRRKEVLRLQGEVIDCGVENLCSVAVKNGGAGYSLIHHFHECNLKPGDEVELILKKK